MTLTGLQRPSCRPPLQQLRTSTREASSVAPASTATNESPASPLLRGTAATGSAGLPGVGEDAIDRTLPYLSSSTADSSRPPATMVKLQNGFPKEPTCSGFRTGFTGLQSLVCYRHLDSADMHANE